MAFVPSGATGCGLLAAKHSQFHSRSTHSSKWEVVGGRRAAASIETVRNGRKLSQISMQMVDESKILDIKTHEVFMPALSSTMVDGRIVQWLKQPGDFVKQGEAIMVVESDKADMDVESFQEGYLASILVEEGASCGVGQTVGLIAENKEDIAKVQECGLDCVVSGSGSRHDGTTAVETPVPPPPASGVTEAKSGNESAVAPAEKELKGTPPKAVPDMAEIFMPALSSTMSEGKVVEWLKSEGDKIEAGQIVMVVESDKADMDVESFEDGYLAHIRVEGGGQCEVGAAVGYLAKSEADIAAVKAWAISQGDVSAGVQNNGVPQATPPGDSEAPKAAAAPVIVQDEVSTPKVVNTGRIVASPWAKKLAQEKGIDLRVVEGSGPDGRIQGADVERAAAGGPPSTTPAPAVGQTAAAGIPPVMPDARKIAKKEKVDLTTVTGTGMYGRITAEDVLRAAGKAPVAATGTAKRAPKEAAARTSKESSSETMPIESPAGAVVMNAMQKAIVRNMNASLSVPVFRVSYNINTDAFDKLYKTLKPKEVTLSAMLAKAVAQTLTKHPILNAAYADDSVVYRRDINVAMAVSLPDGGLITPVLKNADQVDLYSLSRTWKDLVKRAQSKKLSPDEYNSGTFFISNMGMYGVESFDAVLPPGAPAILAVAAAKDVVGVQNNGLIGVNRVMNVNMTCDHRHIYGAMGAEFLRDLASLIENDPMSLLL